MERHLRVTLLGTGPRLIKKRIYRAAVSQRLRNTKLWPAPLYTIFPHYLINGTIFYLKKKESY